MKSVKKQQATILLKKQEHVCIVTIRRTIIYTMENAYSAKILSTTWLLMESVCIVESRVVWIVWMEPVLNVIKLNKSFWIKAYVFNAPYFNV